jgi:ABC-type oligopeptide transport system substrate-binding subunit
MKKSIIILLALIIAAAINISGCKPNGNNNSTDVHTDMRESVDTTQFLYNDSANADSVNPKTTGE